MEECTELLAQLIVTITTLKEGPTLRQLKSKARKLQQGYDQLKGTIQTIAIMQCLAKMTEVQDMKIQAQATRQKEVVVKACIQPWVDEAFVVSTTTEHKVAHM